MTIDQPVIASHIPGRDGLFNLIKGMPPTFKHEHEQIAADGEFVIVHSRFSGFGHVIPSQHFMYRNTRRWTRAISKRLPHVKQKFPPRRELDLYDG